MERFIGTDTASVELFFNIFTSGTETSVTPGSTFVSLSHRSLPLGIGTNLPQNAVNITFRADIVCFNFVLQVDPL